MEPFRGEVEDEEVTRGSGEGAFDFRVGAGQNNMVVVFFSFFRGFSLAALSVAPLTMRGAFHLCVHSAQRRAPGADMCSRFRLQSLPSH